MTDTAILHEVSDFVARRIDEEIQRADGAGDKPALSFALGSRHLLSEVTRDIDRRPWARREVERYLFRTARLHRDHPDFKVWWG